MTAVGTKRVRLKLLQKMFSVLKSEAGWRHRWRRRVRRIDDSSVFAYCGHSAQDGPAE